MISNFRALALLILTSFVAGLTLFGPVLASERMSNDFREFRLPFKQFGTVNADKSDGQFPCNLKGDAPRPVFDLLLKWSGHANAINELVALSLVRDVCDAEYIALGHGRFFIRYRGIGIANIGSGKYTRLSERWVDEDDISEMHQLNATNSIALYQATISSGGIENHGFYALFFHQRNRSDMTIEYAGLTGASAGYVKDGTGEPFCPEDGDGPVLPLKSAGSVLSPSVSTIARRDKAILTFVLRSKDCETSVISNVRQRFIYSKGKLTDQNGKSIQIESLENR